MAETPILTAMKQISEEKNIPLESVVDTIEAALAVAYRKDFGKKNENIKVTFDLKTAESRVFDVKTVIEDEKKDAWEKAREEEEKAREEAEAQGLDYNEIKREQEEERKKQEEKEKANKDEEETDGNEEEEEEDVRYDPKLHLSLSEAKEIKKDAKLEDEIKTELFPPEAYGRMAAQTAKQVIIQRLREAERETVFKEYKDKEGELVTATVQRVEGNLVFVDLGHATAIMPTHEQIRQENYAPGNRLKVYILSVNSAPKGPEIVVSRAHPEIVRKLFTLEVPEISNAAVEIKAIAREAGHRTKIAVFSAQKNIDPIGSCVGQRGSRVQTVITELGGEKIDIVEWSEDPVQFIVNSLSPAKIISVQLNEDEETATAEVKSDQLSLAIGKQGQNVRLSSKLTGWKIDIVSDGEPVTPATSEEKTEDKKVETEEKETEETPSEEPTENSKEEKIKDDAQAVEKEPDVEKETKEEIQKEEEAHS